MADIPSVPSVGDGAARRAGATWWSARACAGLLIAINVLMLSHATWEPALRLGVEEDVAQARATDETAYHDGARRWTLVDDGGAPDQTADITAAAASPPRLATDAITSSHEPPLQASAGLTSSVDGALNDESQQTRPEPSALFRAKQRPRGRTQPLLDGRRMRPGEALSPLWSRYATDESAPLVTTDTLCLGRNKDACDREAICELNVVHLGLCDVEDPAIEADDRTAHAANVATTATLDLRSCARRLGAPTLAKYLSARCLDSPYWRAVAAELADRPASDGEAPPERRDRIYLAQTLREGAQQDAGDLSPVPPENRTVADYGPPRRCQGGCLHFPIGFSIPRRNMVDRPDRRKLFGFLPYVPGHFPGEVGRYTTFSYSDEWLSAQLHQQSFFALTHYRGGWDCMRHYEIISHGAIPYFPDLPLCPRNALRNMPKALLREAMTLRGVEHVGVSTRRDETLDRGHFYRDGAHIQFRYPPKIDFTIFNRSRYFELADAMLAHARRHMTTAAMVAYLLQTIDCPLPKKVLLVARQEYDYLHQSIEDGLADLRIHTVVARHKFDWVMQRRESNEEVESSEWSLDEYRLKQLRRGDRTNAGGAPWGGGGVGGGGADRHRIAGNGWFYGFRVDPRFVQHDSDDIAARISSGEFDLVIYTFLDKARCDQLPYMAQVTATVGRGRRVFVHHNDESADPDDGSMDCCRYGFVFKREMRDVRC